MDFHPMEEGKLLDQDSLETYEEKKMCRICLEEDNIEDFIAPCRCKGTSKWVHKSCLNEWRATSVNRDAFHQCMECHYRYNIELQVPENNVLRKCNLYLAKNTFFFFFINQLLILGFSFCIKALDTQKIIPKLFSDYVENDEIIAYYLLTTIIYISFITCGFTINLCFLRNRNMYCEYYSRISKCHTITSILVVLALILIFPVLGILFLTLLIQSFIKYHYMILEKLDRANNMEITPYNEDDDIQDDVEENINMESKENIELPTIET